MLQDKWESLESTPPKDHLAGVLEWIIVSGGHGRPFLRSACQSLPEYGR